jgi:hypothetical protein
LKQKRAEQKFSFSDVFNSPCTREQDVDRYFQGLLSESEKKEFETHLQSCNDCAALLMRLRELDIASQDTIVDAQEAEKIYQQNRDRLTQRFEGEAQLAPVIQRKTSWNFANVLMLVLVAVLLYPSYRSFVLKKKVVQLQKELDFEKKRNFPLFQTPAQAQNPSVDPIISPSTAYSIRLERHPEQKEIDVSFKNANSAALVFSLPRENFTNYQMEIFGESQRVWQGSIQSSGEDPMQIVSLELRKDFFRDGEYFLRITGEHASGKVLLADSKLLISK